MKLSNLLHSRGWRTFMGRMYGWGAAVVIIGILFKLEHWPYADYFLISGLITEAIIFFLYAFEPSPEEYDWSLVYPELGGMPNLDKQSGRKPSRTSDALDRFEHMVQGIDRLDPQTFESLNESVNQLNQSAQNVADMSTVASASKNYVQSIKEATQSACGLSSTFQESTQGLRESVSTLTESYQKLSVNIREDFSKIGDNNRGYAAEMELMNRNVAALNKAYQEQLRGSDQHLRNSAVAYSDLEQMLNTLKGSVEEARKYQDQIALMNQNLAAMNAVYSNMLSAMKVQ